MLLPQPIIDRLSAAASHIQVEIVAETGSTNSDLLARVPTLSGPTLLLAESQTQGRGRSGKAWLSAPGATLTFSLAWRFARRLEAMSGLPLAVGIAIADALAEAGVRTTLKWPNDIWKDGRKLGGILVESRPAADGTWAVIGIGLNLTVPDELEARIDQPVAEARWLAQMDRHALIANQLNRLADVLAQFDREGFAPFAARWNQLHVHAGAPVCIVEGGLVRHEGIAAGTDEGGRLLLDTVRGRVAVASGDLSLKTAIGVMACCC